MAKTPKNDSTPAPSFLSRGNATDDNAAEDAAQDSTPVDSADSTTETPATPELVAPELDDEGSILVASVSKKYNKYNDVFRKLRENSGDLIQVTEAVKTDTSIPEVSEWVTKIAEHREALESLDSQLTIFASSRAREMVSSRKDDKAIAALEVEASNLRKTVNSLTEMLVSDYGPGVVLHLPTLEAKSAKSGSKGGRALRGFTVKVNGEVATLSQKSKDGPAKLVSSFAAAASVIGCPTSELSNKYMQEVGETDSEKFPVGQATAWIVEKGGKTYEVIATKN